MSGFMERRLVMYGITPMPRVEFPGGYEDEGAEEDMEMRGHLPHVLATLEEGYRIELFFYDAYRLRQFVMNPGEFHKGCIFETSLVIVPRVTREGILRAVSDLHAGGRLSRQHADRILFPEEMRGKLKEGELFSEIFDEVEDERAPGREGTGRMSRVVIGLENGYGLKVDFCDFEFLERKFEEAFQRGESCIFEPAVAIIPQVNRESISLAVSKLRSRRSFSLRGVDPFFRQL